MQDRVEIRSVKLLSSDWGVLKKTTFALGRPDEFPEPRTRFRAEAVHTGKW